MDNYITDIDKILDERLTSTSNMHKKLIESKVEDAELEKNVFINYYLDFSTGIEYVIRQILKIKYGSDVFLNSKIQISNMKSPKFYEFEDIENLISEDFPEIKWKEFKTFTNKCYDIKRSDLPNHPDDYSITITDFKNAYTQAKSNRNILAHGFEKAKLVYSKKTVILFALSFYCLYEYLKSKQ